MNRVGNTYWLSNRQVSQRVTAQALPTLPIREISRELVPTVLDGLRLIPSWILLAMILVATLGICSTVIVRSRDELNASTTEYGRMTSEIAALRKSNTSLQVEIRRMDKPERVHKHVFTETYGQIRSGKRRYTLGTQPNPSARRTI